MMGTSLTPSTALSYLFIWGLNGCVLFFILVFALFCTGVVYTARKRDGILRDEIPLSGKFAMLIIPLCLTHFLLLANKISLDQFVQPCKVILQSKNIEPRNHPMKGKSNGKRYSSSHH